MKLKRLLAATFVVAAMLPAMAYKQLPVDPEVRIGTLKNGLTYYIRHNDRPAGQADFFLAMSVGSVNEEDNQRGLAHFLEHMCFNGTRHFPGNSMIDYLESVGVKFGANLNAYTSTDETVYNICQVPVGRTSTVDSCLLVLRDWSHDLSLAPAEIDAERGVIVGEWRQRMSGANSRILERAMPRIYPGSKYGVRMPIGLMSVVENFKPEVLRAYYEKWYHPYNQAVIVVGDIDVDAVEKEITRLWSDIEAPAGATRFVLPEIPDNAAPIVVTETDPEQKNTMVQIYIKHPDLTADEANTIVELRRGLVADMVCTMLAERLTEVEQAANSPIVSTALGDTKFLMSRGQRAFVLRSPVKAGRATEAVEAFAREVKRAAAAGFTETEFERAKIEATAAMRRRFAQRTALTNTDFAKRYVRNFLDGGELVAEEPRQKMMIGVIRTTRLDDVNDYMRCLVRGGDAGTVIVSYLPAGDATTEAELGAAWTGVDGSKLPTYVDRTVAGNILESDPTPGNVVSIDSLGLFDAEVWTLSNGIRMFVRHNDDEPDKIIVQGFSPGGLSQHYSPDESNVYESINDVLARGGFGRHSSDDLRRLLVGEDIKSAVEVEKMEESVGVSTSPRSFEKAMQVLYLKSTAATADSAAFRNYVDNVHNNLASRTTNPTFVMGDSIHAIVYNHHPFGAKMTIEGIDNLSYDRILEIYRDRFSDMGDFTFFVAGNFDRDTLRSLAERYIASLPTAGRREKALDCGYGYVQGRAHHRFTMPMETPQTIAYTFYNAPAEYTLENVIRGHILGQILQEKLRKDLREDRGWTYSIRTHIGIGAGMNGDDPASLIMPVYIKVSPENAQATFDIVAATVDSLAVPGTVTINEINRVKQYMAKNHADNAQAPEYWVTVMHMYDKFGEDMHSSYLDILEKITPESLVDFAARYLTTANRVQLEMSPAE